MPLVKPIVTGYGMNLIMFPIRATPIRSRNTPAMIGADGEVVQPVLRADAVRG